MDAHLHAGSPTVSKNRQVPPFMQKSPAIGHGCSCLGHAAVAVTNQRKTFVNYREVMRIIFACGIKAPASSIRPSPTLFHLHTFHL